MREKLDLGIQVGAGILFFSGIGATWYGRGYDHAVSFGLGAVFSIAVVALGFRVIEVWETKHSDNAPKADGGDR